MRALDPVLLLAGLLAALAGCAPGASGGGVTAGGAARPYAVRSPSVPFSYADGAAAKKQADAECGPLGVRTSIRDRYDAASGAWVFVEGCA